jgi:uncharacterized protein YfaT (DUF1175 family)
MGTASNSIIKAYICNSNISKIQEGDLLFFFRTKDRHNVQYMGIVEYISRSKDLDQVLSLISKRTVYNANELKKLLLKKKLLLFYLELLI